MHAVVILLREPILEAGLLRTLQILGNLKDLWFCRQSFSSQNQSNVLRYTMLKKLKSASKYSDGGDFFRHFQSLAIVIVPERDSQPLKETMMFSACKVQNLIAP